MGILRLRRMAFTQMPSSLATAIAVIGLAVLGFAAFLIRVGVPDTGPQPLMSLAPSSAEPAPPRGDVRVVVRDMAGAPVAHTDVGLESRFGMGEKAKILTGRTDPSGRYTFRDVEINLGSPWVATVRYDGATFPSGVLRAPRTTTIRVAPVTRDGTRLSVQAESLALVGDATGMQAVQAVTVRNRSRRAFVGGLKFPILNGGTAIDPRTGLDRATLMIDNNNQMVSLAPVLPGSHEFTYVYVASMHRNFGEDVSYATKRFDVLLGGKLDLRPDGKLHGNGRVKLAGRSYRRYTAQDLAAGEHVGGRVVVLKPSKTLRVALPIAAGALALVILVLPLALRRRRTPAVIAPAQEVQPEWT